eukprot:768170-Hanusia_phi.AAC.1
MTSLQQTQDEHRRKKQQQQGQEEASGNLQLLLFAPVDSVTAEGEDGRKGQVEAVSVISVVVLKNQKNHVASLVKSSCISRGSRTRPCPPKLASSPWAPDCGPSSAPAQTWHVALTRHVGIDYGWCFSWLEEVVGVLTAEEEKKNCGWVEREGGADVEGGASDEEGEEKRRVRRTGRGVGVGPNSGHSSSWRTGPTPPTSSQGWSLQPLCDPYHPLLPIKLLFAFAAQVGGVAQLISKIPPPPSLPQKPGSWTPVYQAVPPTRSATFNSPVLAPANFNWLWDTRSE